MNKMTHLLPVCIVLFFTIAWPQEAEEWDLCGVPNLEQYTPGELEARRPVLSGPKDSILTTNFKIHYTRTGQDSVPTTYAQMVADFAQHAWNKLCTEFQWRTPPSDGTMGGDSRYEIYIRLLTGDDVGVTIPESPKVLPYGYSSYIIIKSRIPAQFGVSDTNWLRLTVQHEFTHASQFAYSRPDVIRTHASSASTRLGFALNFLMHLS